MINTVSNPVIDKANVKAPEVLNRERFVGILRQACKKIAPVWPLENFVAVNPYMGLIDQSFENAAAELAVAGGIQMTLPVSFYLDQIREGKMQKADVAWALEKRKLHLAGDVDSFLQKMERTAREKEENPVMDRVVDVASALSSEDWSRFMTARISVWAASYFDKGQAIWQASDQRNDLFAAWKAEAEVDRSPDLSGLKGFRKAVQALPDDPLLAAQEALELLQVQEEAIPLYLHRLLLGLGGWSAYAARIDWDKELYGGEDGVLIEFLGVLLSWEACLFQVVQHPQLSVKWREARRKWSQLKARKEFQEKLNQKLILQDAFDRASQRAIIAKFEGQSLDSVKTASKVKAQAIFCIDVRSEVFRRNLERADAEIETLGFAGFFAFPLNFVPIGHTEGQASCPVLLPTGPTIMEELPEAQAQQKALKSRILSHQLKYVWKSFKSGAVSCFSFVSPMGLTYLPKLFTDSFGLSRPVPHPDRAGLKPSFAKAKDISLKVATHENEQVGIPFDQQVQMGKNALNAMSLTEAFAPWVLIVGHGSSTVNNPHATGYDCGACGGRSGEPNARVAAAVLNNPEVRAELKKEGIVIPEQTLFLACLHDTTTDELHILNSGIVPEERKKELAELQQSLAQAGKATRAERSLRMSMEGKSNIDAAVMAKSKDWSEIRPEWGLAGCSSFVVAPRGRTREIDFGGRAFLHSYDWKRDQGFSVLELIMTAPMVVTSWINLQYYASTVDNRHMGSGNKTLHNVTAGLGVLEGFSGDLRVGLPWQSVHDGSDFQHEPLKLNVIIEAPIEVMNQIIEKHGMVRNLVDNGWILLLAMNEAGKVSHRYRGDLNWESVS